ncbi:MAG: DNA topoisomerase IB [Burkholderiales bacterium]|nr:DNA topoisomerase IB [Burkholderiales bacterium]
MSDVDPGIRRRARGKAFSYVGPEGRLLTSPAARQRIRLLAIPPAWQDVWICPREDGHIQATGRDARGRKQYIYHADWVAVRDANKFARMHAFGRALPRIRRRVAADLERPGIPREKVLATVVRLLDATLIRVGNAQYVRENGSFGLTTLRSRHVDVSGDRIQFEFRGKGGIAHRVKVAEPRLARVVRRLLDVPGQELFRYVDPSGTPRTVDSADVNEYLRAIAGEELSAKDFRTWYATHAALKGLERCGCDSAAQAKREVTRVLGEVAKKLGNTPAICRKSYVHPVVIESFLAGKLVRTDRAPRSPTRRLFRLLEHGHAGARSATPAAPSGRGGRSTGVEASGLRG